MLFHFPNTSEQTFKANSYCYYQPRSQLLLSRGNPRNGFLLAGCCFATKQSKDRLAEEINILYVAATRAKSKLKIPPEINPLQSIELAQQHQQVFNSNKKYYRSNRDDDWDFYASSFYSKNETTSYPKTSNHGKRWTDDEEDEAAELFADGVPLNDISKKLGRGINGVKMKLANMGLLDDE